MSSIFAEEVPSPILSCDVPKTPAKNPSGIVFKNGPHGVADNSFEKGPALQPFPARTLK